MTPTEFQSIRESNKLSRAELAVRLGKSYDQVRRYELGETRIDYLVECAMRSLPGRETA